MKRRIFLLLTFYVTSVAVNAYDACIDGIYYDFSGSEATVTSTSYNSYSGTVSIPYSIKYDGTYYSVTSIGENAFDGCTGLTSVTIPNSVKSIGEWAFRSTGLTSVTIPNSVTSIGEGAFDGCAGLTSVTIPNSVTSIGNFAFYWCTSLTSVTIPNSVTSIGNHIFDGCNSLPITDNIRYADTYLVEVVNKSQSLYTIKDGTKFIGNSAFEDCTGLTEITIPNSVTSIGMHAFIGCTGLTSVTIPNSMTSIGYCAFEGCEGLKSVTIPNSVTSIGEYAFNGCTGLTSVNIPNSVTSIEEGAFSNCERLTSVTIGNSVESIGNYAFIGCTGLTSVTIPNSVTSIGDRAFCGCTSLTSISVEEDNPNYDSRNNCNCIIETSSNTLAVGCKNSVIPNSVTSIGSNAFYGCTGLTEITIPNSVTSIGYQAFEGCTGLTSVTIPNSVTSIGKYAFIGCTGLTSVTIPNSVKSIGEWAFWRCSGLTSITIPNSVTSIGSHAFEYCTGLTSVTISSTTTVGSNAFPSTTKIYYYASGVSLNKSSLTFSALNTTQTLTAIVSPSGANQIVTWTSSNTDVATVSSSGVVTAKGNGTATITAKTTDGSNKSATCTVTVLVMGISLDKTTLAFSSINSEQTLTATVTPSNDANKTIKWTSNNTSVATVSSTGVVTAKGNGKAIITATTTDGTNLKATCTVTVAIPATGISLNKSSLTFSSINSKQTLTKTVTPDNTANKMVKWTSSNINVATVSNTGVVTAMGNGTAIITATTTDGTNLTATCTVTVNTATGISIDKSSLTITSLADAQTLIAIVTPDNTANKTVNWTSSNTSVATVNSGGVITAMGNGTAIITATTTDGTDLKATCTVTVAISATSVSVDKTTLSFSSINSTQTLTATVTPSNAANKTVNWTSNNTNVATVSNTGVVTAKGNGKAIITATTTDGTNLKATCAVTVAIPATGISLDKTTLAFSSINSTQPLSATVVPSNVANKTIKWTSNNTSVATVSSTGVVMAKGNGTAIITATTTDGTNLKATCTVTVAIPATGISLDKTTLAFSSINSEQTLTATVTPSNAANKTVNWTSSNKSVAIVSSAGVVTPIGNGTAIITATTTDGTNLKATCTVSVAISATGISLNNTSLTITSLTNAHTFIATVTPSNAANKNVKWLSSDTTVLKVNEEGTLTPAKNGSAMIIATTTDGTNLTTSCKVTVKVPHQFEATSTQTTFTVCGKTGIEAKNFTLKVDDTDYDFNGKPAKITGLAPNKQYYTIATATIYGNKWTEDLYINTKDIVLYFDCTASPTTLDITNSSVDGGDATVTFASFDSEEESNHITSDGLEPNTRYAYTYYVTTVEGGTVNYTAWFYTKALDFKTTQAKVVSVGNMLVSAESNIIEDENINVGFEWRRYDWPDEIASSTGAAFIYEGMIEGSIKNLNPDKFWRIRPYFKSSSGRMYCGNWITIDPSNTSYFEPTVHTYAKTEVEGNNALVKGYALGGSDQVAEQGFKYWEVIPSSSSPKYPQATKVPAYAKTVTASGQLMTAELQDLQYEMEYRYVAFVTTTDGKTYYGEEQSLKIDDPTGIQTAEAETPATGEVKIYTLTGALIYSGSEDEMQLEKGLYIIRHSDGKTRKIIIR